MTANRQAQAATVLVDRAKAGDRSAFEELVRRYRSRILALALHLCGNESEAEDITQDAFTRLFERWETADAVDHVGRGHARGKIVIVTG